MKNADMPAHPPHDGEVWVDPKDTRRGTITAYGLTKRELFAAMAMQGLLASATPYKDSCSISSDASIYADALLAALDASRPVEPKPKATGGGE